jgi:hypothetical protein
MVASVAVVSVAVVSDSIMDVGKGWDGLVDEDVQAAIVMEIPIRLINTICLISGFPVLLP